MSVRPCAASAASTSEAEARRSVAITGAACSCRTPLMIAVLPSRRISAPMRRISSMCMKRFSKMVSITVPTPSAIVFSAANCACMSVGNAGYGAVRTSTAFGRRPRMSTSIQVSPVSTLTPASSSFCSTASRCSGRVFLMRTWPPVIAPATR